LAQKLSLWKSKISNEIFDTFSNVHESTLEIRIIPEMKALTDLQLSFQNYFPEFVVNACKCVIDAFRTKTKLTVYLPTKNCSLIYETTFSINQYLPKKEHR